MKIIHCLLLGAFCFSGCALLSDPLRDATETDFDENLVEETDLEVFNPITVAYNVDASNPTYTWPESAPLALGPLWHTDLQRREAGLEGLFDLDVSSFAVTTTPSGASLVATVLISSGNGEIWGDSLNPAVTMPAECSGTVNENTTPAEYRTFLYDCVGAFIQTIGVPNDMDISVTFAPANAAALTQPNQNAQAQQMAVDFSVAGMESFAASNELEYGCELRPSLDDVSNADRLEFEGVTVGGAGWSDTAVALDGSAQWYDRDGNSIGFLEVHDNLAAGEGKFLVSQVDLPAGIAESFSVVSNANFQASPAFPAQALAIVEALADGGSGFVCYSVLGDAPRTGGLTFGATGTGFVDFSKEPRQSEEGE